MSAEASPRRIALSARFDGATMQGRFTHCLSIPSAAPLDAWYPSVSTCRCGRKAFLSGDVVAVSEMARAQR